MAYYPDGPMGMEPLYRGPDDHWLYYLNTNDLYSASEARRPLALPTPPIAVPQPPPVPGVATAPPTYAEQRLTRAENMSVCKDGFDIRRLWGGCVNQRDLDALRNKEPPRVVGGPIPGISPGWITGLFSLPGSFWSKLAGWGQYPVIVLLGVAIIIIALVAMARPRAQTIVQSDIGQATGAIARTVKRTLKKRD